MAGSGRKTGKLNSRQRKAIAALLSMRNVPEAAAAAKVGERTLYRWLTDPEFKRALQAAEGAAIDAATRRLIALQEPAIMVMTQILADKEVSAATRLRASTAVLDYLLKLRELRNIEERLTALEAAQHERAA